MKCCHDFAGRSPLEDDGADLNFDEAFAMAFAPNDYTRDGMYGDLMARRIFESATDFFHQITWHLHRITW
jgi:hypothetical protein